MLGRLLKPFLPRGLYWRAALIVFFPVAAMLFVFAIAFIQRHYDGVTRQMTENFVLVVRHIDARVAGADDPAAEAQTLAEAFGLRLTLGDAPPNGGAPDLPFYDLSGKLAERELREGLPDLSALLLSAGDASLWVETAVGPLRYDFSLSRISARNPHQLLVLMIGIGLLMGAIAFVFLKNQMRPIRRLAVAAEAFGRGESQPLRVGGATEVRAAGRAFLQMRERIERHIEQRTLLLSGVSHDLRTPLTRMKLAVSMLSDEAEAEALNRDIQEMESLVDRFLEFASSGASEQPEQTDLGALLSERCAAHSMGAALVCEAPGPGPFARIRRQALTRAIDNVLGNALRYGKGRARASVRVQGNDAVIEIEDAGPGIEQSDTERALRPFVRLDIARGQSAGSGVGLGLAIVADVVKAHGGQLVLGRGARPGYGGLCVTLSIPLTPPDAYSDPAAVGSKP